MDMALFADPNVSSTIDYAAAGESPVTVRALVEGADVAAMLGGQLVEQTVLGFTVLKADIPDQPKRGGSVTWAGRSWFVGEAGWSDEDDLTWTFKAARRGS